MSAALKQWRTTLGQLLGNTVSGVTAERPVSDICMDSREVSPGCLFFACAGLNTHGVHFAADAVRAGAIAVAWEPTEDVGPPDLPDDVAVIPVPRLSDRLGEIAHGFFGEPSTQLRVIGVTGTNGKTTTSRLIALALEETGFACGLMGTTGWGRPGDLAPDAHTTPDVITTHRRLARLRDGGARGAVMEVSSHALDQNRVDAVLFDTAVFTNLTRDHLDYHGSLDAYGEAKSRLFDRPDLAHRVLNVADTFGRRLLERRRDDSGTLCYFTGRQDTTDLPDWVAATGIKTTDTGCEAAVSGTFGTGTLKTGLLGEFNVENLLAALGSLLVGGMELDRALQVLAGVGPAPGRMETFGGAQRVTAVVDYAHTPDALRQALRAARAHCAGRLWCVFGCGGDRDRGKRPLMGAVAAELADRVILTDDNPRTEDPDRIVFEIGQGMPDPERAEVIRDRAAAIRSTIEKADPDDLVLIAGKGHEEYQEVGDKRLPFSDRREVKQALGLWR